MFEVFNMNVWWEDGGWVHKLLVKKNVSGSFILKYSFLIQMVSRTEGNIDNSHVGEMTLMKFPRAKEPKAK